MAALEGGNVCWRFTNHIRDLYQTNRKTNRNRHRRKDTFCVLCFDIGMIFILFSTLDFLYKFNRIVN